MIIKRIDRNAFNEWQADRHYLKRKIIRSKLLAHGVFLDNELVGGLLWVIPHFTKKKGLFGYPGLLDKWEVLMLGRFWLSDDCNLIASKVMAESIGKSGRGRNGSKRRGWRLQTNWVLEHPPKYIDMPFVPRLLISFSDSLYGHSGTIYSASGWILNGISNSGETNGHTGRTHWVNNSKTPHYKSKRNRHGGEKKIWIMNLGSNPKAYELGLKNAEFVQSSFL